jgi:hypothetical protein
MSARLQNSFTAGHIFFVAVTALFIVFAGIPAQ